MALSNTPDPDRPARVTQQVWPGPTRPETCPAKRIVVPGPDRNMKGLNFKTGISEFLSLSKLIFSTKNIFFSIFVEIKIQFVKMKKNAKTFMKFGPGFVMASIAIECLSGMTLKSFFFSYKHYLTFGSPKKINLRLVQKKFIGKCFFEKNIANRNF